MESRRIPSLFAIAMVTMKMISATPIPPDDPIALRSEINERDPEELTMRSQKVIGTCLQIAPDLLPCDFDSEATWRSRSGEIFHGDPVQGSGYPMGILPELLPDGNGEKIFTGDPAEQKDAEIISQDKKNLEEFDFYQNDLDITVVYYLEGCLPARLPFDLPSCPIVDELQTVQMNKLVPFQLPDVEDALVFPETDMKQIEFSHRHIRNPKSEQSHEENEEKDLSPDGSSKMDRSSSFLYVKTSSKFDQGFHKIMAKSTMNPRTGTASTKYFSMQLGSGFGSMASGLPWGSEKNKERSRIGEEDSKTIVRNV